MAAWLRVAVSIASLLTQPSASGLGESLRSAVLLNTCNSAALHSYLPTIYRCLSNALSVLTKQSVEGRARLPIPLHMVR